jgi:hypothetical protein
MCDFVIASAGLGPPPEAVTVVVVVAELLAVFGSGVVDVTFAVFVTVPGVSAVTTIWTTWLAPLLIVPKLQVIGELSVQSPPGATETNLTLAGRASVTVTFAAFSGPLFVAVMS